MDNTTYTLKLSFNEVEGLELDMQLLAIGLNVTWVQVPGERDNGHPVIQITGTRADLLLFLGRYDHNWGDDELVLAEIYGLPW